MTQPTRHVSAVIISTGLTVTEVAKEGHADSDNAGDDDDFEMVL